MNERMNERTNGSINNNPKRVTQFTRTVYSTPEFIELQRAAKQAGARIIGTKTLPEGRGITVTLEVDGDRRQF